MTIAALIVLGVGALLVAIDSRSGEDACQIGATGEPGAQGDAGIEGPPGLDGAQGPPGPQGTPGYFGASWGSFRDCQPQYSGYAATMAAAPSNTPTAMRYRAAGCAPWTPEGSGISIGGENSTDVIFETAGAYNLQFSTIFSKTNNSQSPDINVWLMRSTDDGSNWSNVEWSNTPLRVPNDVDYQIAAWNFVERVGDGERLRLMWQTDRGTTSSIDITQPSGAIPGGPSIILTVAPVSN